MKDFRNFEIFACGIFESAHFGWVLDLYEITSRPWADFGNFFLRPRADGPQAQEKISEIYPRTRVISYTNVLAIREIST